MSIHKLGGDPLPSGLRKILFTAFSFWLSVTASTTTTSEQTSFEKSTRYHFTRFLLNLWSMVTAFQTHAERPAVGTLHRTLNGQHPYA